jgi:hypothetical protein
VNKTVVHVSVARPQYLDLETTPVSESVKKIVEFINANPRCTRRKMIETLAPTPKPAVLEVKPDEPKVDAPAEPTPEQTALIADLHWLIHQGHVLEFADARMETAKKPLPRPARPEKAEAKPEEAKAEGETKSSAEKPAETTATEAAPPAPSTPEASSTEPASSETTPTEEVPSPS